MERNNEINLDQYKAGHHERGPGYLYFVPTSINAEWRWQDPQINRLLETAARKLGELHSLSKLVPDANRFILLYVTQEAVVSSRIEGTQTFIEEAVLPENEINPERREDWKEVKNYIRAMNEAIKELERLPISTRLIRNTHRTLLTHVRGKDKRPGEFRSSQNWIGGASLADAIFIPPHHQYVDALMSDLENFLHNEQIYVPDLIRIAIAHYQFETIHPFLDGNGRIGRLLITLYLISNQSLRYPLLYLSGYFERDKGLYYDNLSRVREKNDMKQWLKYFLVGIEDASSRAISSMEEVLALQKNLEATVKNEFGRRAHTGLLLLDHLYQQPYVTPDMASKLCKLSYKAGNELVAAMADKGILREITGQSRNRIFLFKPYLDIFTKYS